SGLAPPLDAPTPDDLPTQAEMESTPFDAALTAPTSAPPAAGDLAPGNVKLVVEQGQTVGAQFVLGDAELLVGREDEDEEIYPDIDLSDQDAGYVHRRHATLTFQNGNLSVTHLGGSNKTRINNKPIADNVPQTVKLGDKIAFGKVVLRLLPV
ncbi:MAG: FHA domain-containing protein, partial [Armatimonadetes bacterium]|nr:FHA domain-containing protein [Armatimonadota bacterium]